MLGRHCLKSAPVLCWCTAWRFDGKVKIDQKNINWLYQTGQYTLWHCFSLRTRASRAIVRFEIEIKIVYHFTLWFFIILLFKINWPYILWYTWQRGWHCWGTPRLAQQGRWSLPPAPHLSTWIKKQFWHICRYLYKNWTCNICLWVSWWNFGSLGTKLHSVELYFISSFLLQVQSPHCNK